MSRPRWWPGGLALLLSTLLATSAPAASDWRALVAEGEQWWWRSPDPAQPVACGTCHHEVEAIRGWAASFPKLRPLPPPHARVMTLLQANAEAVARHYRLDDPGPVATAITAFLAARGAGRRVSPGITADQPVFPTRLRALGQSVARGRRLYNTRCRSCHEPSALALVAGGFRTGTAEPIEFFLEAHGRAEPRLAWDSPGMADLLAYLAARRAGEPLVTGGPGGAEKEEASR